MSKPNFNGIAKNLGKMQTAPKRKPMRFSDEELGMIKSTFAENLDLLKVLRKVMLQLPLSKEEEILKLNFKNAELMQVIKKCFLPELDGNAPINQMVDLMMTLQIAEKTPEQAWPHIKARDLLIKYIKQQLNILSGDSETAEIDFANLVNVISGFAEDVYISLVARNTMIQHTEQQLQQLDILAGLKSETTEETLRRIQQNSNK